MKHQLLEDMTHAVDRTYLKSSEIRFLHRIKRPQLLEDIALSILSQQQLYPNSNLNYTKEEKYDS